jgi:hypothetical protein
MPYAVTSQELIFLANNAQMTTPDLRILRAILVVGPTAMDDFGPPMIRVISSLLLPAPAMSTENLSLRDVTKFGIDKLIVNG